MTETPTLKEALAQHTHKPKNVSQENVLAGLEEVLATPWEYEVTEWHETVQQFIQGYLHLQIAQAYTSISPTIKKLTTTLKIPSVKVREEYTGTKAYTNVEIQLPLFALVDQDIEEWIWKGEGAGTLGTYPAKFNTELHASVPRPPPAALAAAAKATATVHIVHSTLFEHRTVGSYLAKNHPEYDTGKFLILWRPEPNEIRITASEKDRDPALVWEYNKHLYLVATWDIPGEKPYKAILSEFTTNDSDEGCD